MIRLRMKDELARKHKCATCENGQVVVMETGEVQTSCGYSSRIRVHGIVSECTMYDYKYANTPYEMRGIGWVLETRRGKPIGFLSPEERKKKGEDDI